MSTPQPTNTPEQVAATLQSYGMTCIDGGGTQEACFSAAALIRTQSAQLREREAAVKELLDLCGKYKLSMDGADYDRVNDLQDALARDAAQAEGKS